MKRSWLLTVLCCLLAGAGLGSEIIPVMPIPTHATALSGELIIDSGFSVRFIGYQDPRLVAAVGRFSERLSDLTGILHFGAPESGRLDILCERDGESPESYTLEIGADGARLEAETVVGVLRGLETMLQLVRLTDRGFTLPALRIEDAPRFPWRGLLIDVARHFQPVHVIKRNLDAMAAVKLNVLHWHLTDDQGFRIETRRYPKLHLLGSNGDYYTTAEIRDVVTYAMARGIRVVPELDVPGHVTSWLVGYPELGSAPGPYSIEKKFGIQDATLDPTNEAVYELLDGLFEEIAELFPDPYVHIGGDEVTGRHWDENPAIQKSKDELGLRDNRALQAYFNARVSRILTKHGKRMIGWDEILHPDLPSETVVQSWRGKASLDEAVRSGFEGILSFGYYLDHMFPASFHYGIDPGGEAGVLGGEACMWGELVTVENIDSRIWPRAAAIAERLWSGGEEETLYARLDRLSRYLDRMGIQHESARRRMLERLAGEHPPDPLVTLADVLEPVRFYARTRIRTYETDTPLNRLVDAVRPESVVARLFELAEDKTEWLVKWRDNHEKLGPLLRDSQLLHEVEPLSLELSKLAEAGLDALRYLDSGESPPDAWVADQRALLSRVAGRDFSVSEHMETHGSWPEPGTWWNDEKTRLKPVELELAVVPAIASLVERAAER